MVVSSKNVNKSRVHHSSEKDQELWYQFHRRTIGYRFFSKTTGEHVDNYIIFYKYKYHPNLLKIADGTNTEFFSRANAKYWSNGECNYRWVMDQKTFAIKREMQLRIFEPKQEEEND